MDSFLKDIVKVMEPILLPEPFDSAEFFFQVKWDGVRMLAVINDGKVRLINKHWRDKTAQYPEMQQLAEHLKVKSAVLDGEVVVLKERNVLYCKKEQLKWVHLLRHKSQEENCPFPT